MLDQSKHRSTSACYVLGLRGGSTESQDSNSEQVVSMDEDQVDPSEEGQSSLFPISLDWGFVLFLYLESNLWPSINTYLCKPLLVPPTVDKDLVRAMAGHSGT